MYKYWPILVFLLIMLLITFAENWKYHSDVIDNTVKSARSEQEMPWYVGNKSSGVYHVRDCDGVVMMNPDNKVFLHSRSEGESMGYRPHEECVLRTNTAQPWGDGANGSY